MDFNNALINALNIYAPLQTKQITIHRTVPWFTDDVRELKNVLEEGWTIWRKYKREDTWTEFKVVKSKYRFKLQSTKREILSKKVLVCRNDTRKLYALVNSLTGVPNNTNPLPECDNYEQLAEDYVDHFMTKIKNIHDNLDIFPKYDPPLRLTPRLTQFNGLTMDEVQEMMNNMQAKTCDSDPIPTKDLKEISPLLIEQITNIINISLTEGVFATSWKLATIKPLLKKLHLDPIVKN